LRSQFPETALVVAAAGLGFRIALTPAEDQEKLKEQPIQRLMKLAKERDRSVNYLVVQAILILEFLKREEKK
jgi:hypothetical protein